MILWDLLNQWMDTYLWQTRIYLVKGLIAEIRDQIMTQCSAVRQRDELPVNLNQQVYPGSTLLHLEASHAKAKVVP